MTSLAVMSPSSLPEVPLPGSAAPYLLTLDQAATVLGVTPAVLMGLVRANCVHALSVPAHLVTERPALRFAPDLLAADREQTLRPGTRQRGVQVAAIARALETYLSRQPTDVYREAMEQDRPFLARTRRGESDVMAHVRLPVLKALCNPAVDSVPDWRSGSGDPVILGAIVVDTLERWGFREMKGLRDPNSNRQHWDKWWRVPLGVWSPGETRLTLIDAPVFNPPDLSGESL